MKDVIIITLKFHQPDPKQAIFSASLESLIPDEVRCVGERHSTESGLLAGKSVVKNGPGAIMLDTALAQLREAGYGLNDAYVAHDDGRNDILDGNVVYKITFFFIKGSEEDVDLASLFVTLTKESGWVIKCYENGGEHPNTAFGCTSPSNMAAKMEKATAKGRPITPPRLQIFA